VFKSTAKLLFGMSGQTEVWKYIFSQPEKCPVVWVTTSSDFQQILLNKLGFKGLQEFAANRHFFLSDSKRFGRNVLNLVQVDNKGTVNAHKPWVRQDNILHGLQRSVGRERTLGCGDSQIITSAFNKKNICIINLVKASILVFDQKKVSVCRHGLFLVSGKQVFGL
jgi:hypothetical protein